MVKITITKEEALDLLDSDAIIRDTLVDNARWTIQHELIFKRNGRLYRTYYRVGATEMQDERPFEYDGEVICIEVRRVLVTGYEPVEDKIEIERRI